MPAFAPASLTHLFALLRRQAQHLRVILIQHDAVHAGEHLLEVLLQARQVLAVADNFQQILVANEVEAREGGALALQVLAERLLDLGEQVGEALQLTLHVSDVEYVHDEWRLGDFLHQPQELGAHAVVKIRTDNVQCTCR